jgi:hypothetical protein
MIVSNTSATVTNTTVTQDEVCYYEASCRDSGAYRFKVRVFDSLTALEDRIPGVKVTLTGPGGCVDTATTDAYGLAQFNDLAPGDYTVTPTLGTPHPGCTFSPTNQSKTIADRNVSAPFIGICP